jgi:hypothetical protein
MQAHISMRRTFVVASLLAIVSTAAAVRGQAVMGVIDGGYWANGQYSVVGWACDEYSDGPVTVTVVDPNTGSPVASAVANDPSEPAVGNACSAPWATNLRFHVAVDAAAEEALIGQTLVASARSSIWTDFESNYLVATLSNSWIFTYQDNAIRGTIDNVSPGSNQVTISGWACAYGIAQSIWVHVYAGGPAGTGQWVTAALANQGSEGAVASACGVAGGAYRYSIVVPFGPDVTMNLGGLKVYAHGINPVAASNLLVGNSGVFSLPGQAASVSGGCGYVPALWNAPYGSLVVSRSNGGSIRPVIVAIGEYYTHSMLSLGTTGIMHAEMKQPDQNSWPTACSTPLNSGQLQFGYPGAEQINLGGAYADLQGEEITPAYTNQVAL